MHPIDFTAILLRVSGLSVLVADTTFSSSINSLFGPWGPKILAAVALSAIIATDVLRVYGSPTSKGQP